MRDLIERQDAFGHEMKADLTAISVAAPGSLADGQTATGRSSVHAGASTALSGPPTATGEALRAGLTVPVVANPVAVDAVILAAMACVHALWDHAVAVAAEDGPMPLVGTEAWVEEDEAYAERLGHKDFDFWFRNLTGESWPWDAMGESVGLPRARLVPVEG